MPLSSIDFFIFLFSLDIINHYLSLFEVILCIIGIIALVTIIVLGIVKSKARCCNIRKSLKTYISCLMIFIIFLAGGKLAGTTDISYSDRKQAYDEYGFVYCFSSTMIDKGINEPDEYSYTELEEIIARYEITDYSKTITPNIIVVQLESFFDTEKYNKYELNYDPIPNFHKICSEFGQGSLSVPSNGGGTVNTEFEVLTGMNLEYFGAIEYPYTTILKKKTCESAPYILSDYGYTSHAIHNHTGVFYRRNEVYPNLGFDTFTPLEYMQHTKNELGWAKDEAILKYINDAISSTVGNDFIFTVTVEGHGMYIDEDRSDFPFKVTGREELSENEQKSAFMYEHYCTLLNHTDMFIGNLYDYVMDLDEDTVVILYGDHLPSIDFDKSKYKYKSDYQTTYTVFSNIENFNYIHKDIMPANVLMSSIFDKLSINNGLINRVNRKTDSESYYKDLKSVQYDMLYGDGYSFGNVIYQKKDTKFGICDIEISNMKFDNGYLTLYGENFTIASKIAINGWERDTEFIDQNTIRCACNGIDAADIVSVRQNAVDGKTLSETFYK